MWVVSFLLQIILLHHLGFIITDKERCIEGLGAGEGKGNDVIIYNLKKRKK